MKRMKREAKQHVKEVQESQQQRQFNLETEPPRPEGDQSVKKKMSPRTLNKVKFHT